MGEDADLSPVFVDTFSDQAVACADDHAGRIADAKPMSGRTRDGAIANFIFGGLTPPVTVTATATVTVTHSIILGNQAIGGAGTTGGNGQGGGIANLNGGILTVSNSLIALNRAIGGEGNGGNGGNGQGGGIFNGGAIPIGPSRLTLQRSLIALNQADGGASVGGNAGLGRRPLPRAGRIGVRRPVDTDLRQRRLHQRRRRVWDSGLS